MTKELEEDISINKTKVIKRSRPTPKKVYFSDEELELLNNILISVDLDFNKYARSMLLNGKIEVRSFKGVEHLSNISNSINEIKDIIEATGLISNQEYTDLITAYESLVENFYSQIFKED